jgi:hypothetical protein
VALEAVKGTKTINEIAQEFGEHPTKINKLNKDLLENAGSLFEGSQVFSNPGKSQSEGGFCEIIQAALFGIY